MKHLLRLLLQRLRAAALRRQGVVIAPGVTLDRGVGAHPGWRGDGHAGRIALGQSCRLEAGVCLEAWGGHIQIEHDVFLGPYVVIYGHGGVDIGADTLVSMHCAILSSNHALPPRSTAIRTQPDELLPTRVGRDVWLGANVVVLGGVTIGDGCVVGAGAVVTHDLPAYSIAVGVPAQVVRQRE